MALEIGPTQPPSQPGRPADEEIRRLREYAKALHDKEGSGFKPQFYTWANALGDVTGALASQHLMNKASMLERQNTGLNRDATDPDMPQGGGSADAPFDLASLGEPPPSQSPQPPSPRQMPPQQAQAPQVSLQAPPSAPEPGTSTPDSPSTSTAGLPITPSTPMTRLPSEQTRVAQALQQDPRIVHDYQKTMSRLIGNGMNPQTAQSVAAGIYERRFQNLPQFSQPNDFGQVFSQRPGQMPSMAGSIPGYQAPRQPMGKIPGTFTQPYLGPDGKVHNRIILPDEIEPEVQPPASRSDAAPAPAVAPGATRGLAQAPAPTPSPVATTAPTATTLLGNTPPDEYQEPFKVAGDVAIGKTPTKLAQASKSEEAAPAETDPLWPEAQKYLQEADKNPDAPLQMPDVLSPAMKGGPGQLSRLYNLESNTDANKAALEDQIKESNKEFAKNQTSIRDAQTQAVKLRPALKAAKNVLQSPDFQSGPANKVIELGQGAREELGRLARNLSEKKGDVYDKTADWALDPNNHTATANQIYTKLVSGTVLQSLRGMLGPNAGQFRQYELQLLKESFGNTGLTLGANKAVMSMIDKINDRNILIGKMADTYAGRHGKLDNAFNRETTNFQLAHPTFTPDEENQILKIGQIGKPAATPGIRIKPQ